MAEGEEEKSKKRLGYQTPATNMEDDLASALKSLMDTKKSWAEFEQETNNLLLMFIKEYQAASSDEQRYLREKGVAELMSPLLILLTISRLGKQVVETHERLAKVERAIRELKLAKI